MKATLVAAVAAVTGMMAAAQSPGLPADTVFETASIKLNRDGGPLAGMRRSPGGRFDVTNMPLAVLISFAYQLQPYELQGGPSWIESDRWDIVAKIEGNPPPTPPGTPDAIMLATRTLLTERFKLVVRSDTRDVDVYQLIKARADGRLGPGLKPSTTDCLAIQKADASAKSGRPTPSLNTPDRMVCGMRVSVGRVQLGGRPLSTFMNILTTLTQRRVVDRTGLTGDWEFDISFAPPPSSLPGPQAVLPPDSDAASLFTVLQEQLGLKLEAARMPMPVLVVEQVERPVAD
jgi:uncharacterized protein (TIGR03435 family)